MEKNESSATSTITTGLSSGATNLTLLVESLKTMLGVDEANLARLRNETEPTNVALARLGYRIVVGQAYFWTYVVLASALLSACFVALVVDGVAKWQGRIPRLGLFALLDMIRLLRVDEVRKREEARAGTKEPDSRVLPRYRVTVRQHEGSR